MNQRFPEKDLNISSLPRSQLSEVPREIGKEVSRISSSGYVKSLAGRQEIRGQWKTTPPATDTTEIEVPRASKYCKFPLISGPEGLRAGVTLSARGNLLRREFSKPSTLANHQRASD